MIRYTCPSCQRQYESIPALAGFTVICWTCKQPIKIPAADSKPEDPILPHDRRAAPTPTDNVDEKSKLDR
jgi:predicted amidophosphoribosyltransferase